MIPLLSFVFAAMLQAGGTPAGAVKTLEKGADSAIDSARQVTARTQAEWAKVWQAHSFERELPKVDFSRDMVVGVFMGSQSTAGFGVEIVGTRQENGALIVEYRETKPGREKMTAQILTAPYHLVTIPRFAGDVRFEAK